MWRIALLLTLACAGCEIASLAQDGWPCDPTRPCAAGFVCQGQVCVAPSVIASPPDVSAPDAGPGADTPEPDTGSNTEEAPAVTAIVAGDFLAPGAKPRGLALSPDGLWVGDEGLRQAIRVDAESGVASGTADLPAEGDLVDLAWDGASARLVGLLDDPGELWELWPTTTRLSDGADGVAAASDSQGIFVVSGGELQRWEGTTSMSVTRVTTIGGGCDQLAASGGQAFRLCDKTGFPTVGLTWIVESYDATRAASTPSIGDFPVEADVQPITGLEVSGSSMWLTGRGYGTLAGHVVRVVLR